MKKKLKNYLAQADFCINLIGILYEKNNGNTFKNIHSVFPTLLAKLCKKYNLQHLVHVSALGINEAADSKYAISKLEGEKGILNNFSKTTILRPSVVFSNSDNFSTQFMTLLNRLPIFPLYYSEKLNLCQYIVLISQMLFIMFYKMIFNLKLLSVLVQKLYLLKKL